VSSTRIEQVQTQAMHCGWVSRAEAYINKGRKLMVRGLEGFEALAHIGVRTAVHGVLFHLRNLCIAGRFEAKGQLVNDKWPYRCCLYHLEEH